MNNLFGVPGDIIPLDLFKFSTENAKSVSQQLFEQTVQYIVGDTGLSPTVFIFTNVACLIIDVTDFISSSKRRDDLSFILRKIAKEQDVQGIAMASAAVLRKASATEMQTGEIDGNTPVAESENKEEALIVQCEWYTGDQYMITGVFTKEKDAHGKESLDIQKPVETNNYEGRFANLFPPTRSGGYLN